MLTNIFKRKRIKEVYLLEREFLVKVDIIQKKDMLYIKQTKILKNNFKLKERLKEHFDVFFQNKKRNKIFPIIKLTENNVNENKLNYAVKIGETADNIIYSLIKYHKINVKNKIGVVFYLGNEQIKKEDIKFQLKIGKDFTYAEIEEKKGLMVIS